MSVSKCKILYLLSVSSFLNAILQKNVKVLNKVLGSKSDGYCTVLRSSMSEAKANPYLRDVQQEAFANAMRLLPSNISSMPIDYISFYQNCI